MPSGKLPKQSSSKPAVSRRLGDRREPRVAGCAKTATQLCRTFGLWTPHTEKRTEEPTFLIACVDRLLALPKGAALGRDKDALRSQMKGPLESADFPARAASLYAELL
jgi:hypothetical protein